MAERGGSESSLRGNSGGGLVSYQDLEGMSVDQYDFINAPQYVDFEELGKNDDPNADHFFGNKT